MSIDDRDVVLALIRQVVRAAAGGSELEVVTLISEPMWAAFCRGTGLPVPCEPTEWLGGHGTRRVCGSRTVVIKRNDFWSVSKRGPAEWWMMGVGVD